MPGKQHRGAAAQPWRHAARGWRALRVAKLTPAKEELLQGCTDTRWPSPSISTSTPAAPCRAASTPVAASCPAESSQARAPHGELTQARAPVVNRPRRGQTDAGGRGIPAWLHRQALAMAIHHHPDAGGSMSCRIDAGGSSMSRRISLGSTSSRPMAASRILSRMRRLIHGMVRPLPEPGLSLAGAAEILP